MNCCWCCCCFLRSILFYIWWLIESHRLRGKKKPKEKKKELKKDHEKGWRIKKGAIWRWYWWWCRCRLLSFLLVVVRLWSEQRDRSSSLKLESGRLRVKKNERAENKPKKEVSDVCIHRPSAGCMIAFGEKERVRERDKEKLTRHWHGKWCIQWKWNSEVEGGGVTWFYSITHASLFKCEWYLLPLGSGCIWCKQAKP